MLRSVRHRRCWANFGGLGLVLLVGCALRIQSLGEVAYWFDESFCLRIAEYPAHELVERISHDTRPPLYFLLLKAWRACFGPSPVAARAFSAACGLVAIWGSYLFVREGYARCVADERATRAAALVAGALVALSPLQIDWSQQVNAYALGAGLVAVSSWLLMRAAVTQQSLCDWLLYALFALLLAYTHPYCLLIVGAQFAFALFMAGMRWLKERTDAARRSVLNVVIAAFVVEFGFQFWMPVFLSQRSRVMDSFWSGPLSWPEVGRVTFLAFAGQHMASPHAAMWGLWLAQAVIVVMALLAMGRRPADAYLACVVGLPLAVAITYSFLVRNILIDRYLVFQHLLILISVGVLLGRVPQRGLRIAVISATLLVSGWQAATHWSHRAWMAAQPGMPALLAHWHEARRPGEPLVVCNPMLYMVAAAYAGPEPDCATFGSATEYPFYFGTAATRESDYVTRSDINDSSSEWIWTLDAADWQGRDAFVPLNAPWRVAGETSFNEYYARLVLRLYRRETGSQNRAGDVAIHNIDGDPP